MCRLLAISLWCLSQSVIGATYWVTNSGAGAADGSSEANACAGFTDTDCDPANLTAGDTYNICDTVSGSLVIEDSGAQGNALTITDDNCATADQGGIDGAGEAVSLHLSGTRTYIDIDLNEITGADTNGSGNVFGVRLCGATGPTECEHITLTLSSIHDIGDPGNGNQGNGLWGYCDACDIDIGEIYNIPTDGVWLGSATNTDLRIGVGTWPTLTGGCHDVETTQDNTGDCVQIAGDFAGGLLHDSLLDHSSVETKQAVIINGGGAGRVERVKAIMGTDETQSTSYACFFTNDNMIIESVQCIGGQRAINLGGDGTVLSGFIARGARERMVVMGGNDSPSLFNGVADCNNVASSRGTSVSGTGYKKSISNVLYLDCSIGISKGGTGTLLERNNAFSGNDDDDSGFTKDGSSVTADPDLSDPDNNDYVPNPSSPLIDAGAHAYPCRDVLGGACVGPVDIGAHQIQRVPSGVTIRPDKRRR